MSTSPSVSTSRTCVRPASTYKMNPPTPSEPSYFSIPQTYSTSIPVSTPLVPTTSSPATSDHQSSEAIERPLFLDHEMLDHFAAHFPPPPASLTLPRHRQQVPDELAPRIVTLHPTVSEGGSLHSSTDRAPRVPLAYSPTMDVSTTPVRHTFRVQLPNTIKSEMITISANKGDKLKIVADAWHMQSDCHYEWLIFFAPRDVDLAAVQARFESSGHLTIDVRRTVGHAFVL